MKQLHLILATIISLTLPLAPATAVSASTGSDYEQALADISQAKISDHDRLWRLFDTCWQHQMHEYPEWATSVGYPGQNGRWTDMSLAAVARRNDELGLPLITLASIDRSALNKEDQLNYDIFKYQQELDAKSKRFPNELMPINQLQGVQEFPAATLTENPNANLKDYEAILERLNALPTVIDQYIALMEAGLQKGITPPRITLRDVPQQIKNQIVSDPLKSPLLLAFNKFPADIAGSEQERLKKSAATIYSEKIAPAYQKLLTYFTEKYLPHTRESIALSDLPDGKAWYAYNAASNTTTTLPPAEIHRIGLDEVKRIRGEMGALITKTGFKGGFQEFTQFLRSDKQFFYNNADELIAGYRDIAKRIDPQLMKQFGKLPRLQYGVQPVPAYSENSQPTAYYRSGSMKGGRAGIFFANTYNIQTRPKWEMEALTLHEAVPGHHLQISLAQELDNVPEFRRHAGFTAYTEGWGLYSESLGNELGMYENPYARYGQLTYEMWRSIRLVLDTGIHSMGWTRQQAIDFFKDNSSKSEHDITVEVDRYIVWPGQALGYKIGQLTFKELRDSAKKELGERFDIRAFHDSVLNKGALPLDILRAQTATWVAEQAPLSQR